MFICYLPQNKVKLRSPVSCHETGVLVVAGEDVSNAWQMLDGRVFADGLENVNQATPDLFVALETRFTPIPDNLLT
jgi:hypothetical protein